MRQWTTTVLLVASVGLLLAVPRSATAAVILQVNGSGILTGAKNVDVGGTLYDVQFLDGTCVAIFSGCDAASDFDFTTEPSALAASQALLDQVFLGIYDTNGALTAGCTTSGNQTCGADTPYLTGSGLVGYAFAFNQPGAVADVTGTSFTAITTDLTGNASAVWADWSPAAAADPVPEPASLLLLGSGIAGIAAKVRRRRQQQVQ